MKLYLVLALSLVTLFVSACQSSGSGESTKVYPRKDLQVSIEGDADAKDNSILVEGRNAEKVVQDYTYIADKDSVLTIGQVVPVPVNCDNAVEYKMTWVRVDGSGQEVAGEAVVADESQIKVTERSNYLLRVEVEKLKCLSYSLVFRVFKKDDAEAGTATPLGTANAGQKDEENAKLKQEADAKKANPNAPSTTATGGTTVSISI